VREIGGQTGGGGKWKEGEGGESVKSESGDIKRERGI